MTETTGNPKRRREDNSPPPKVLSMPGDICKHCNKKCTLKGKNSEAVQCDVCFVWVHASCEGFTKDQYKTFSDLSKFFPNIAYCCKLNGCLTRLNQLITSNNESESPVEINEVLGDLKKNYSQINETIAALSKNIDSLFSNNTELDNKVNTLSKSIESNNTHLDYKVNTLSKSIESSLSQPKPPAWEFPATFTPSSVAINVADELSERNKRKCNVVVHNLPEPSTATNDTDINCFADICRGELGIELNITKSIRLGQKVNSKPRSVLVKLNNEASRNKLLSLAPKLRFSSTWYQLYIQPDMTPTEREAYRKLQEELKRRKNMGETNLIIRNGKIIQYMQKKFRTRVLTNSSSTVTENEVTRPPVAAKSQDSSTTDPITVSMSQNSHHAPVTIESNDAHSSIPNQEQVEPMIQDDTTSS